ncbi:MAG: hypothetical protein LBQ12_07360, partial [Deltaproteobacteria bacterium]|nr:hypothetical protein [Deltaproteobacteria bacterium]
MKGLLKNLPLSGGAPSGRRRRDASGVPGPAAGATGGGAPGATRGEGKVAGATEGVLRARGKQFNIALAGLTRP